MHLLKLELKRAFFSVKFILLLIVTSSLLIIPTINRLKGDVYPATMILEAGYTGIIIIIIPLLAAVPFAGTYAVERSSGFLPFILYRVKTSHYLWAKFTANVLASAAIIVIPVGIFFAILLLNYGEGYGIGMSKYNITSVFQDMKVNNSTLYGWFLVFQSGLFTMTYATVGMAASTIFRKPIFAYAAPFVLYVVLTFLTTILSKFWWAPGVTWNPTSNSYSTILSVYPQLAVILGTSVFIIWKNFGKGDHI
ncbi:hypothetical protein D7Z54_04035 [Salibacterium salarium]|uniref:ABC-2 type transport system permease protein n=1 Tax=Salibacterium salarium TaxID=284579 RepID=A0A428N7H8_9BACI|nr:hypothetical protein [Salibacterium salarium]RSL34340.1 hypothetical protein D7Z54_04035 [Salibacterium salarium]